MARIIGTVVGENEEDCCVFAVVAGAALVTVMLTRPDFALGCALNAAGFFFSHSLPLFF